MKFGFFFLFEEIFYSWITLKIQLQSYISFSTLVLKKKKQSKITIFYFETVKNIARTNSIKKKNNVR